MNKSEKSQKEQGHGNIPFRVVKLRYLRTKRYEIKRS
jgi:hypothetical protein